MANVSAREAQAFQAIIKSVESLISASEEVLLEACQPAPNPSEFQKNPEVTKRWILENQQTLTELANLQTKISIEDRRLWVFGEELKRNFGVVEMEDFTRRVNFHLKSLRDIREILREKKADLVQIFESVRSVQTAVTSRFRATQGG